ncbi:MAG: HAD-IA family hydrolase [Proteobacteria bacterium]|nr:HAD-IA family hydrolase [Pseudomonadota bacterium]
MTKPTRLYAAYLFDLDGTLVDTAPDLGGALDASLRAARLPGVSTEQARNWIGLGARFSLTQALQHYDIELDDSAVDQLLQAFLDQYEAHIADTSAPYAGVIDTLDQLTDAGIPLAVVTNKPARFTLPLLSALSLDGYFATVISGDTAPRPKPAADPILLCLSELGICTDAALMVGDAVTDVNAAKAAKVDVACFADGYNQGQDVYDLQPTWVFERMDELLPPRTHT